MLWDCSALVDKGTAYFQNVTNLTPNDAASYPRKPESSATQLHIKLIKDMLLKNKERLQLTTHKRRVTARQRTPPAYHS
jgi:hypothetical protein